MKIRLSLYYLEYRFNCISNRATKQSTKLKLFKSFTKLKLFKSVTGLTVKEFDDIYKKEILKRYIDMRLSVYAIEKIEKEIKGMVR